MMASHTPELVELILPAWETSARVTRLLVAGLPSRIWDQAIPGLPRRTPRMMSAHLHNSRCGWVRTLGKPHGIKVPARVDPRSVTKPDLLRALRASTTAMSDLLEFGCTQGGAIPPTRAYVWRNLALDVGHVLTYFVAHEAHHRGQLSLIARQLGSPVRSTAQNQLWWWKPRT